MNENVSLGRIAGIHVGLNWSLLVIAALIAWSLASNLLPSAAPGQTSGAYLIAGVVSAFVYLACLLAQQLAGRTSPDPLRGPPHEPAAGRRVFPRVGRDRRWHQHEPAGRHPVLAGLHQPPARSVQPPPRLPSGRRAAPAIADLGAYT